MRRQSVFIAVVILLLTVAGFAQMATQLPAISIALPPGISSERVWGQYFLYGDFGAFGGAISGTVGSHLLRIPAAVDGKPAGRIKMFVWTPGCKIVTFDIPLHEASDIEESFVCSSLATVSLVGQINQATLRRKRPVEVRLDYLASWACGFFGLSDCMVPQVSLGTANPDAQGTFRIDLPDFSADPVSSDLDGGAEIQLVLREVKTWNLIAFLEPEVETWQSPGRGLKIVPSYPENLVFLARKAN